MITDTKKRPSVDPKLLKCETRPCRLEDLFTVEEGGDPEYMTLLREYFGQFCAPVYEDLETKERQLCPGCGEFFGGLMANLGHGVGIEWGLVHGEGNCSKCRYPYRGMHRPYDPKDRDESGRPKEGAEPLIRATNLFLAYLPSQIFGWKPPKNGR